MAISLKTAGTWARVVTDPSSVTIPGSPAAGDRMFLFANWKTFDVTVADPNGWTPIVNSFADGTTAAGNGTGSVSVAAWFRDWQSGDGNPSLNWSASPTEAHAVVMLWTKAGGDTWGTPQFRTGAIASADPFTVNASATATVSDASVVIGMIALRDDETAIARATDAIDDTGGLVTWNGNYVESPATHFTSTTGLDMAGDLGHRFVTTGAAGVTLHMDGDPTAAETGTALFVLQDLFVSNPQSVTPSTASLTTTTFAPTVTASDHKSVTPGAASLVTATFAPTVSVTDNALVTPDPAALSTATFAPTVTTTAHQTVTPDTAALTLTGLAPTVTASDHQSVTPGAAALTLATFAPTVSVSDNIIVTPDVAALNLAAFAPTVSIGGGGATVTPDTVALTLATFAPTVTVSSDLVADGWHGGVWPINFRASVSGPSPTWLPLRPPEPVKITPKYATLTGYAPTVYVTDDEADILALLGFN